MPGGYTQVAGELSWAIELQNAKGCIIRLWIVICHTNEPLSVFRFVCPSVRMNVPFHFLHRLVILIPNWIVAYTTTFEIYFLNIHTCMQCMMVDFRSNQNTHTHTLMYAHTRKHTQFSCYFLFRSFSFLLPLKWWGRRKVFILPSDTLNSLQYLFSIYLRPRWRSFIVCHIPPPTYYSPTDAAVFGVH